MKTTLIGSIAAVALLAAGGVAMAQDAGGNRAGAGAADGGREMGNAGGRAEKMQRGAEGGGGKMGAENKAGRQEKADRQDKGDRQDKAERKEDRKDKMGAGEPGHEKGQKADRGDRDDHDRADKGDRGEPDRADRGERERDRADRGERGDRERADRGERETVRIRVGGAIPEGRRLAPLRGELVTRYPQYRGFESFVENDEIIIVDPGTHKIVRTVSEGEAGMNHRATNCD